MSRWCAAALLLAGCGPAQTPEGPTAPQPAAPTDATSAPGTPASTPSASGSATTTPARTTTVPPETTEFSWGLPGGDLSVDAVGAVFNTLRAGRCAEAQELLDTFLVNDDVWTAGQEQLYRAALATCAGDPAAAGEHLRQASLTTHPGDCRLYRAVVSVLEQRAQEDVVCPEPTRPEPPPRVTSSPTTDDTDVGTGPTP